MLPLMSRIALLLPCLFVAACTVGELPTSRNGAAEVDAGALPIDAAANANACIDRVAVPAVAKIHSPEAGGGTHAGDNCLQGGCHSQAETNRHFQFGGTVYKADGVTPNPGVTIRIKPARGGPAGTMVSDDAGNFSLVAGQLMMAFPATVEATACPNVTPMVSQVAAGGGGACSSAGCHAAGSTQGVIKFSP
jgi:hypothetical protein